MPRTMPGVDTELYQQIHQFYAHHMQAVDDGDLDAWAAGFTTDAVFASNGMPAPLRGRDAIDAKTREGARTRSLRGVVHRHLWSMPVIKPKDGGIVAVRSYVLVLETPRAGATTIFVMTVCEDILIPAGGSWLIQQRLVSRDDLQIPVSAG